MKRKKNSIHNTTLITEGNNAVFYNFFETKNTKVFEGHTDPVTAVDINAK